MLKILLIVGGVLIIVISLIVIIGLLLPVKHSAKVTAKYGRSQNAVWEMVSDYAGQSRWRSGVKDMVRLEDREGQEVWKEERGRGDTISYMLIARDPPRMLRAKIVDNKQFGGTWTWIVNPTGESECVLTITEDGEIYNPIFRVVSRFIMGYDATMKAWQTDLAAHFGEPVQFSE